MQYKSLYFDLLSTKVFS